MDINVIDNNRGLTMLVTSVNFYTGLSVFMFYCTRTRFQSEKIKRVIMSILLSN